MRLTPVARRAPARLIAGVVATALSAATLATAGAAAFAPAASAAGLACVATNTLGLTQPGWDDTATTPPTTLSQVEQAVGATSLYGHGIDGTGIGVAEVDSGVVPVEGLTGAGKVINGPDLSFEN